MHVSRCVYVYVCMYAYGYMYICVYVCVCVARILHDVINSNIYIHKCTHIYVHHSMRYTYVIRGIYVCLDVFMYMYVCIHVCVCVRARMYLLLICTVWYLHVVTAS